MREKAQDAAVHPHDEATAQAGPQAGAAQEELSAVDAAILEFERTWFTYGGAKDHAIRERFDLSAGAYFQRLSVLLDDPRAYAHDPILIKRLRRIRDSRQRSRSDARLAR
ncbi:MAG TPA: DUF3263 domain-containing protein [Brevibacterium senegalense]|uniref:DUF3263 domain-containing protein n=1 Tax=Brevibacterium senegalense TaxID=1033736 RepID=A0A921MEN4_9MICO|nr:DUF3263 domain-containing protein [Brevibacterium senegalense]